ncbi:MAG: sigma factor-like helix-turn-helix DNA-binding protein [Candidatus Woesearchaeota archaeon]|jgi:transcriptional regulator
MLTEKEIKVLELRKKGHTQVDVALKLNISQAAVSSFEKNAIKKIDGAIRVVEFSKTLKLNFKK